MENASAVRSVRPSESLADVGNIGESPQIDQARAVVAPAGHGGFRIRSRGSRTDQQVEDLHRLATIDRKRAEAIEAWWYETDVVIPAQSRKLREYFAQDFVPSRTSHVNVGETVGM